MPDRNITRRLAAILAADVVDYSRLMGVDEVGTLNDLKAHRKELVDPSISRHNGRIVKTTGDGMLVEFASVIDAVSCAVAIQRSMFDRNSHMPKEQCIVFRIGINVGDIIYDDGDIFGDGVNVAARLEALCEPGGVCISRSANDQIRDKLSLSFSDLGEKTVKNIARTIGVYGLSSNDIADLPMDENSTETVPIADAVETLADAPIIQQEIRFCMSGDGTQIAYATTGSGPPLVKAPNWLSHLEFEWQSPIWKHLLNELGRDHQLVRFDQRGNGLSDWDIDELNLEAFVADLETVVDALELDKFPILGISQGCATSIAYAVRHPDKVSCLALYGGFPRGQFNRGPIDKERAEAMITLIRHGWGGTNPAFRQMFTSSFVPECTHDQMQWFNEMQRVSASAENAAKLGVAVSDIDVMELLPQVSCPTLVLHCRGDGNVPFNEGKRMAAGIRGAKFVSLEGNNHLILEHELAWPRFKEEVRQFLAVNG